MQYGHEEIFNLLKDVYGADTMLRDWSGRKPHQYLTNKDTVSADTFRSEYDNPLKEWYRRHVALQEIRHVVPSAPVPTMTFTSATLPVANKPRKKARGHRYTTLGLFTKHSSHVVALDK